jgi:hypothetical protein
MNIGGMADAAEPDDCHRGKHETQDPQDSLPFATTRDQHNAIGSNREHAAQRAPPAALSTILRGRSSVNGYALRIYSRMAADSLSICCTRCFTTSPIETIPTRRPWATTGT